MVKGNIVIAIIIIALFVFLGLIGFGIYWAQTKVGRTARGSSGSSSEGDA
jgi:hypothetical protein